MEPIQQPNYKTMATVLWIALITAIVVTIIDWKIKSDILRLTDAFYRVYPDKLEAQHEGPINKEAVRQYAENHRPSYSNSVLRFPVVDPDSRMEEETVPVSLTKNAEDHSGDWAKFAPGIETGIESKADANSE